MPRITLKDVAARAGVSYQTVSKVLNGRAQVSPETAARIWEAVQLLNYKPNMTARNLRIRASGMLGYSWHAGTEAEIHPILESFVNHVTRAAEAYGYRLVTFVEKEEDPLLAYHDLMSHNQVDGFIVAETNADDERIAWLIAEQVPFVAFGRANDLWEFSWVDVDGLHGIYQVMQHLLGRDHRRIALITWPEGSQTGHYREQGYQKALAEVGLESRPEWIIRGEHDSTTGAWGMQQLLALPADMQPTAVVCVSDLIAIGAIGAASAAGLRVGHDIAVTGFDDIPLASNIFPALTTVRQPIAEIGRRAVDLLLRQLEGDTRTEQVLLCPEVIVRESG